jgi:hypothetical protein
MAAGHIWMLTFVDVDSKDRFVAAGDFTTREGALAQVNAIKRQRYPIRVHWVPFYVPMAKVIKPFAEISGVKVVSAQYDKSVIEGLTHVNSLVRTVWVETDTPNSIPHAINWRMEGQGGQALVTMRNRAPVCLKCFEPGHMRKSCPLFIKCRVCKQSGHDDSDCSRPMSWASAVEAEGLTTESSFPEPILIDEVMAEPSSKPDVPVHVQNTDTPKDDVTAVSCIISNVMSDVVSASLSIDSAGSDVAVNTVPCLRQSEWPSLPSSTLTVNASVPPSNLTATIPETQPDNNIIVSVSHSVLHQDLAISDEYETSDEKGYNNLLLDQRKPSVARTQKLSTSSSEGENRLVVSSQDDQTDTFKVRLTSRQRRAMRRDRQKAMAHTLKSFKKDVD